MKSHVGNWGTSSFHDAFLKALPVPVFVIDSDHRFKFANPAFLTIFGLPESALIGRTLWEYWPEEEFSFFKDCCEAVIRSEEPSKTEFQSSEDPSVYEISLTWWDGHVAGVIIDVTMQRRQVQIMGEQLTSTQDLAVALVKAFPKVMENSNIDELTGLNNRRRVGELGQSVYMAMHGSGRAMSLLMLDIDHFKKFNDTFGHAEGDNVLRLVGATLKSFANESETVARIGGEEFVVVCPNIESAEATERGLSLLEQIRSIKGTAAPVTASIGIATLTPDEENWLATLSRADEALYQAKALGRDCVVCWNPKSAA